MSRPIVSPAEMPIKIAKLNQATVTRDAHERFDLVADDLRRGVAVVVRSRSGKASLTNIDAENNLEFLDREVANMGGDCAIDVVTSQENSATGSTIVAQVYKKYPALSNSKGTTELRKVKDDKPNVLIPCGNEGALKQVEDEKVAELEAKSKAIKQIVFLGDYHCNPDDVILRGVFLQKMLTGSDEKDGPIVVLAEGLEDSRCFMESFDEMFKIVSKYSNKIKTKEHFFEQIITIDHFIKERLSGKDVVDKEGKKAKGFGYYSLEKCLPPMAEMVTIFNEMFGKKDCDPFCLLLYQVAINAQRVFSRAEKAESVQTFHVPKALLETAEMAKAGDFLNELLGNTKVIVQAHNLYAYNTEREIEVFKMLKFIEANGDKIIILPLETTEHGRLFSDAERERFMLEEIKKVHSSNQCVTVFCGKAHVDNLKLMIGDNPFLQVTDLSGASPEVVDFAVQKFRDGSTAKRSGEEAAASNGVVVVAARKAFDEASLAAGRL